VTLQPRRFNSGYFLRHHYHLPLNEEHHADQQHSSEPGTARPVRDHPRVKALETAEKVLFGDQEASFDVDGESLLVTVPDGSGTVDVTVEGADGESDLSSFTIV